MPVWAVAVERANGADLDKSGAWRIRGAPEGPGLFVIALKSRLRGALCASLFTT